MADQTYNTRDNQEVSGRVHIAQWVIFWSGVGIALVSFTVIVLPMAVAYFLKLTVLEKESALSIQQNSLTVFNALIPLFGTWVGTVLAYFFSRENFLAAAQSTRETAAQAAGDEKLKALPVMSAWTPISAIVKVVLPEPDRERGVTITQLRSLLVKPVTRIPVLDAKLTARYIIHESQIYKFMADNPAGNQTLDDFLKNDSFADVVKAFGFVSTDATLADAKTAMNSIGNAQDIFVTQNGKPTEPVLGWITNADIARQSRM